MIKYLNENDIPDIFLCRICKQICEIPVFCMNCESLVCHECVIKNKAKSESIIGCQCNENNDYVPEIINSYFLDQIQIACKYCTVFKKYCKYQRHLTVCSTLHTSKINYQQYFHCNQETIDCELCKQKLFVKFNCTKCLNCFCTTCFYENKQGLCQSLCGQEQHQLFEDKSFKIKLNCNNCNLIIDNHMMIKHTKDCIIFNNIQKAAQQEYQSNVQLKYPFYFNMANKSLQEANKYQSRLIKFMRCRVDDTRIRQDIITQENLKQQYIKRLKDIQDSNNESKNK